MPSRATWGAPGQQRRRRAGSAQALSLLAWGAAASPDWALPAVVHTFTADDLSSTRSYSWQGPSTCIDQVSADVPGGNILSRLPACSTQHPGMAS